MSSPFKILVVEDEPMIREYMGDLLDAENLEVKMVGDGAAAIKEVHRDPPHLVLLDVVLPVLDGLSVCRMLKSDLRTAHLPVYLVTAKIRPEDRKAGITAGADGYLEKPVHADDILSLVERHSKEAGV